MAVKTKDKVFSEMSGAVNVARDLVARELPNWDFSEKEMDEWIMSMTATVKRLERLRQKKGAQ